MHMIDRKALLKRHNPCLFRVDTKSPLTVGNGDFAFTADVTGLQTLYSEYKRAHTPLCTLSHWGWHTEPNDDDTHYTLDDLEMTTYEVKDRQFHYPVAPPPGGEHIYRWLRHNPHRCNLARLTLLWDGGVIRRNDLSGIRQVLDLYTGILDSEFAIHGTPVRVRTFCACHSDTLGVSIQSPALPNQEGPLSGRLTLQLRFPYASHQISASDWRAKQSNRHTTSLSAGLNSTILTRTMHDTRYTVICTGCETLQDGAHRFTLVPGRDGAFTLNFAPEGETTETRLLSFEAALHDSSEGWATYWNSGGAVDFSGSIDPRALELERRTVLSQYLCAIHSSGRLPPQETGLACNSWYGKFHLEMHILHSGWFPLWGRAEMLERSFDWYLGILDKARANAARNGFRGARWPKMVGPEGVDCPSFIAPLLIWQQPHILYMLELVRRSKPKPDQHSFMRKYEVIIRETADFMCDFATLSENRDVYDLPPPLIPAQEVHDPLRVNNPTFELCYWRFGLDLAVLWATLLGDSSSNAERWRAVRDTLTIPAAPNNLYIAYDGCTDTFDSFNQDHPSMLYGYGFIPSDVIDPKIMGSTANHVLNCWNLDTAWGWDFALIAMTYTRLGRPEDAVSALMMDARKNRYVTSGNNYQYARRDLPLYLPGNGSLLMALSMMLSGYGDKPHSGFPEGGAWRIEHEGIMPLPF